MKNEVIAVSKNGLIKVKDEHQCWVDDYPAILYIRRGFTQECLDKLEELVEETRKHTIDTSLKWVRQWIHDSLNAWRAGEDYPPFESVIPPPRLTKKQKAMRRFGRRKLMRLAR